MKHPIEMCIRDRKRYKDPAQGAGPGTMAQYWEPIPYGIYLDPATFYKPPTSNKDVASRKECVECHTDESPVWVQAWKRSSHANLDKIRNLKPNDPTFYKKGKLEDVEKNLRSHGKLAEGEQLKEVGCIDCHVEVGAKKKADHAKDLKMPTADVCGICHLQEFAERESERDTMIWPAGQWPDGRPSHALDYKANVETTVWAAMPQREVAEGCSMCHLSLIHILDGIEKLSQEYGLRCMNVFHAGDGNLHPLILYDANQPGELERTEEFGGKILEMCIHAGGTITGEHGVGMEKINQMCTQFRTGELEMFHAVKAAFDPAGLLNPGKAVPTLHRCAELGAMHVHRGEEKFAELPRF